MKRNTLCLLLAVLLAMLCPLGALAAREYTLPEKMRQQLQLSSLNGSAKLLVEGDGDWVKDLEPFANQLINFYYTENDGQTGIELYAKPEEDAKAGRTVIYGNGTDVFLKSDLLIDTVLRLPVRGDWLSTLTRTGEGQNPSFYSVLPALLQAGEDWDAATESLRAAIEMRLDRYADTPRTMTRNGETLMEITYTIPADQIPVEMKSLLPVLFADGALLEKLRPLMSEEQAAVYLSPNLQWYYERLIDGLQLEAPVTMRRSFNTLGESRETELHLPLTGMGEWTELTVLTSGDASTYTLSSDLRQLSCTLLEQVTSEGSSHWRGVFLLEQPEAQAWDVAFDIVSLLTTSTDEEKVDHEVTTLTVKLEPAPDAAERNALLFDPAQIRLRLHYHSKGSVTNSTTLDVTWDAALPGGHTNGAMKLRTVFPVDIEVIDGKDAIDLSALSDEERQVYLQDFLANARLLMLQLASPEAAATEAPAAEAPAMLTPVEEVAAESAEPESTEAAPAETENAETAETAEPTEPAESAEAAEPAASTETAAEDAEAVQPETVEAVEEASEPTVNAAPEPIEPIAPIALPLPAPEAQSVTDVPESLPETDASAEETASAVEAAVEENAQAETPILIEEEVMLDDEPEGV